MSRHVEHTYLGVLPNQPTDPPTTAPPTPLPQQLSAESSVTAGSSPAIGVIVAIVIGSFIALLCIVCILVALGRRRQLLKEERAEMARVHGAIKDEPEDDEDESTPSPAIANQDIHFEVAYPIKNYDEQEQNAVIDELASKRPSPRPTPMNMNMEQQQSIGIRMMRSPSRDHGTLKSSLLTTQAIPRRPSAPIDIERRVSIALDAGEVEQKVVKSPSRMAFHDE